MLYIVCFEDTEMNHNHGSIFCSSAGGCGSFYAIKIKSDAFKGLPMVKQHRMVNDALKEEIQGIHGLQVRRICPCNSQSQIILKVVTVEDHPPMNPYFPMTMLELD